MGAAGAFQAPAAPSPGLHAMGAMRGGTPPLDAAALSAQVNLAGFGLGGLGNGARARRGPLHLPLAAPALWLPCCPACLMPSPHCSHKPNTGCALRSTPAAPQA